MELELAALALGKEIAVIMDRCLTPRRDTGLAHSYIHSFIHSCYSSPSLIYLIDTADLLWAKQVLCKGPAPLSFSRPGDYQSEVSDI